MMAKEIRTSKNFFFLRGLGGAELLGQLFFLPQINRICGVEWDLGD
jgi:hypothetical protein